MFHVCTCNTFVIGFYFYPTGVKRFVYVSAADSGVINYLLQGYYDGKVTLDHVNFF